MAGDLFIPWSYETSVSKLDITSFETGSLGKKKQPIFGSNEFQVDHIEFYEVN